MNASAAGRLPGPTLGWLLSRDEEPAFRLRVAREAQATWAIVPLAERARRLDRVADELIRRMDELVALIGEENGKSEVEAIGHEVGSSIGNVRWICANATRILEDAPVSVPLMLHRTTRIGRAPFGACVVISPWNFPLSIPLGQVVAGLVAGNAVILKPSEVTPRIGAMIAELLQPCGLPPNLFQVVEGDGRVGAALIDAGPDKVFFTGSLTTGRTVMAACAKHPIPVSLELGGIDALIVCDDADLEHATSAALWGATMNGGQVCASVERILVDEAIAEAFVGRLLAKAERLDPASVGRVTMPRQAQIWERHVADAQRRGLTLLAGGQWAEEGRRFQPTFIAGDGVQAADVYRDETFGPIAAIATFRGDDQAVRIHNDTAFGLTASVFSASTARGYRIARRLDAGLVAINDVAATLHAFGELPWGGKGASGFGRSHGEDGLLEFTWSKVVDAPQVGVPDFKRPWWYPYDPDQVELMRAFARLNGSRRLREQAQLAGSMGRSLVAMLRHSPRI